jgi:hypothetical protein
MTSSRGRALSELLVRLVGIGVMLTATAMGPFASPATVSYAVEPTWAADAPSTSISSMRPTEQSLTRAIAEIEISKRLLSAAQLKADSGFRAYLEGVDQALSLEEHELATEAGVIQLSTLLAWARHGLEKNVSTLPRWLAIARAVRTDAGRSIDVPARFILPAVASIDRSPPPSSADVRARQDLERATS